MTAAQLEEAHQAAWSEAVQSYQALHDNPHSRPIVDGLAGRDYGTMAGGNGTLAAILYKADLADGVVKGLPEFEKAIRADERAKAEKEIRPAVEREVRAKLSGEEPRPDTGVGDAPPNLPRTLPEMRRYIAALPPAEYARREAEIDRHLASLLPRKPRAVA